MMKNKVLIKAVFPTIDRTYDIKIPVNELVWKVNSLVVKAVYDMNGISFDINKDNFVMISKNNGTMYENNVAIMDTDIRNGSEIIFLKEQ